LSGADLPIAKHNIRQGKTDTRRFRINLNVRVYISAAGHEIRFGKPRDNRSSQPTLMRRRLMKDEVTTLSSRTTASERVYISAIGCEIGFGAIGLQAARPGVPVAQRRDMKLKLRQAQRIAALTLQGNIFNATEKCAGLFLQTVEECIVFNRLELALSEKQMPRFVGIVSS
jgi:hypothetical protein